MLHIKEKVNRSPPTGSFLLYKIRVRSYFRTGLVREAEEIHGLLWKMEGLECIHEKSLAVIC